MHQRPDQCTSDLTACTTCPTTLASTQTSLTTCNGNLTTCQSDLTTCAGGGQGLRLKTGQTTCYDGGAMIPCSGTGQDGELQKGLAASYTDNGNGTITDTKTGLVWEKLSSHYDIHYVDGAYDWTNAFVTKVATLNSTSFAGFNDWRVPNVNELQSLVNYAGGLPAINAAFTTPCGQSCTTVLTCSCTADSIYWSSSTMQDNPPVAWKVDFSSGKVSLGLKADFAYVRAVRGAHDRSRSCVNTM